MFCISERAAADCVQLGIHVDDVQRAVRRRRKKRVRLHDGRWVSVKLFKNVIWRVRPGYKIEQRAIDQANRIGIDSCRLLQILAQPRLPGGVHTLGTISATVLPLNNTEVVTSIVDHGICEVGRL